MSTNDTNTDPHHTQDSESASEMKNKDVLSKIPQRPFSLRTTTTLSSSSSSFPSSVSIVGLGCSSFSTFFWSPEDWQRSSTNSSRQDDTHNSQSFSQWTVDQLDREHPMVQEWIDTIAYAIQEAGITVLDTAPWYGHGTSEVVVGWALSELLISTTDDTPNIDTTNDTDTTTTTTTTRRRRTVRRDLIMINTKVGRYEADPVRQFAFSYETTIASVQRSVQRLQCQYLNVIQLHDPEFAPSLNQLLDETIPALLECRDTHGWCKALGLTGYPLHIQHQLLQATLERFPNQDQGIWSQALVYGHYNLCDTSLFQPTLGVVPKEHQQHDDENQEQTVSFATYCANQGLTVLAAAPLSMGLFTNVGPPAWHPATVSLQEACRTVAQLCRDASVNVSELALLVALAEPHIPCTIVGCKNVAQVQAAQRVAQRVASIPEPEGNSGLSSSTVNVGAGEGPNHSAVLLRRMLQRLRPVLSRAEVHVLEQLWNPHNGPFASVWRTHDHQWDGVQEAISFWSRIPNAPIPQWHAPPPRPFLSSGEQAPS